MARQAQQQAAQNVTTAQNNAGQVYGSLEPDLTSQYTNPQGFGQPAVNAMTTQAGQVAGANAAKTNEALNLQAERTHNPGGFAAGQDQAEQTAIAGESNADLGIQAANAQAKLGQQAQALSGMNSLYGTNVGAEAPNVNAEISAGNSGWLQNTMGVMGALGGASQGLAAYNN